MALRTTKAQDALLGARYFGELSGARKPAATGQAERQKRYRRRVRDGGAVLHPAVPLYLLIEALIQTKRITPQAALDRDEIDKAAAQVLIDFATRWRE